ncbi:Membrane-associated guanylate kinase, WW and PDZ domain-containing protein 2 [Triplophysa tibetana]|uniref:Membrane-associated guanylate kinase, WW and PDZ domain-containing protein 2 n=1 Tax=Triplophysa tibetana TaxID=1572043 RepID=A0A5A9PRD9_9TELE|nr:Membrane-associated guanylate kinase, WW and PDZ domain-containing protein 2 [Triplophysa tibetana]
MSKSLKKKNHWTNKVHEAVLSRNKEGELGFELKGGAENGNFPYFGEVKQGKVAIQSGKLSQDELLLEVNDTPVAGLTIRDVLAVIKHCKDPFRLKCVKQGENKHRVANISASDPSAVCACCPHIVPSRKSNRIRITHKAFCDINVFMKSEPGLDRKASGVVRKGAGVVFRPMSEIFAPRVRHGQTARIFVGHVIDLVNSTVKRSPFRWKAQDCTCSCEWEELHAYRSPHRC